MEKSVALVTGAGRGIGRAIAIGLATAGYRLVLTARNRNGLEETAKLCGTEETEILPADLTEKGVPEELIRQALKSTGSLDVLVNNAGAVLSRPFEETGPEDWNRMMSINAQAPFLLTRAALPALRRSAAATVVNIGSVVSEKGYPMQAAYTASKHALAGWTKVLARELRNDGIRVHLVMPGGVATDMVRNVRPDIDETDLIAPEEVATAVLFLVENRGNAVVDSISIHRVGKEPFS